MTSTCSQRGGGKGQGVKMPRSVVYSGRGTQFIVWIKNLRWDRVHEGLRNTQNTGGTGGHIYQNLPKYIMTVPNISLSNKDIYMYISTLHMNNATTHQGVLCAFYGTLE